VGRENQLVGAFGEKAVEAELLRRGWLTSNVNASIRNAADYDIIAVTDTRTVHLRIKTCGPGWNAFQFGGFRAGEEIVFDDISESDYTILVQMGKSRSEDAFYVIPTKILRKQISLWRRAYLGQNKKDGEQRKDLGHWTLHLSDLRSGDARPSHGFARIWQPYLDSWASLT
jgi:hypothetical protein